MELVMKDATKVWYLFLAWFKTNYIFVHTLDLINGEILLFLIGDLAYPLQTWLMKPFPQSSVLTSFNYRISRTRIVIENAYGCLSSNSTTQWGSLSQTIILPKFGLDNLHCFTNGYIGEERGHIKAD